VDGGAIDVEPVVLEGVQLAIDPVRPLHGRGEYS
jgi:hypothetical protein